MYLNKTTHLVELASIIKMVFHNRESINRLIVFDLSKKKNIFYLKEAKKIFNIIQHQMPIAFYLNAFLTL